MKTLDLDGYLAGVNARKTKRSPDGVVLVVESCRNSGARRTIRKQSALSRADVRARAAGLEPIPSNY